MASHSEKKEVKIAFVVGVFPAISETFIINQVADLIDRGIDVEIFALQRGNEENVSERYFTYGMRERVSYLTPPRSKITRLWKALGVSTLLFFRAPRVLVRALSPQRYGAARFSLLPLFWTVPFVGKKFDITHCHFGTVATKYLIVRRILGETSKFVTTFYGYDVSHIPQEKGIDCYKELITACDKFLVMSENMKLRVLPLGVPKEKIEVHPISIDVESYPFHERALCEGEKIQITSVGRFVEKKGFDDLLRAIRIVKDGATKPFVCTIVGDGVLKKEIYDLADTLGIQDFVDFKGYMKLEDVLSLYEHSHLYVQSSKTAKDGDME